MSNNKDIDRTIALISRAYNALGEALAMREPGEMEGAEYRQLMCCKAALEKMLGQIESRQIPPLEERESRMGRMIVDSWPFDSALGNLLLQAEQQYMKL